MTRRLSSALVCSGTQTGGLAVGYARSEKSPDAVMKADASSVNHRLFLELYEDRTLFAPLEGKFNQTRVKILPGSGGERVRRSAERTRNQGQRPDVWTADVAGRAGRHLQGVRKHESVLGDAGGDEGVVQVHVGGGAGAAHGKTVLRLECDLQADEGDAGLNCLFEVSDFMARAHNRAFMITT